MNEVCPICFHIDGTHEKWCPNFVDTTIDFLKGLFNGKI